MYTKLQKTLWTAAFIVFIAGFVALCSRAQQAERAAHYQPTYKYHYENAEGRGGKSIWERTTDDPVALFTFWLVIFTGALSAVSMVQISFLNRSDKTARIAADAASKSANAAVGVELPSVHIEHVGFLLPIEDATDFTAWMNTAVPNITVKNYGRTPAFITDVNILVRIGKTLPIPRRYAKPVEYITRVVLTNGEPKSFQTYRYFEKGLFLQEKIDAVTTGDAMLFVYGYLTFNDFMDRPHTRGFVWGYVVENKSFIPLYNPDYHYQT